MNPAGGLSDVDQLRIRLEGWVTCWQHRMACGGGADRVPHLSRRMVAVALGQALPLLDADSADVVDAFAEPSGLCVADAAELLNAIVTDLRTRY